MHVPDENKFPMHTIERSCNMGQQGGRLENLKCHWKMRKYIKAVEKLIITFRLYDSCFLSSSKYFLHVQDENK